MAAMAVTVSVFLCLCCWPFAASVNGIGVEGAKFIGAGLAANTTLTSLYLYGK